MSKDKPTITDLVTQHPEIANSVKKMERVKLDIEAEAKKALLIKVDAESKLSICEQSLTKLNDLVKVVEVTRVAEKDPFLRAGQAVDAVANYIKEAPVEAMKHLKEQKIAWITRCEKLQNMVSILSHWCQTRLENVKTLEHCDLVIDKLSACPAEEVYFEYYPKVKVMVENYTKLFNLKKTELIALEDATPDEIESIQESIIEAKEAIVEAQEVEVHSVVKKVRRPWIHEVVDINEVPREFLMIDEKKVKEWIKENSDKLKEGQIINGIKYKQDLRVTS